MTKDQLIQHCLVADGRNGVVYFPANDTVMIYVSEEDSHHYVFAFYFDNNNVLTQDGNIHVMLTDEDWSRVRVFKELKG